LLSTKGQAIDDLAFTFGPFQFRPQQRLLTRSGIPLRVGSRTMDILSVLLSRVGEGHLSGRYIENIPGRGYSFVATVERQNHLREQWTPCAKAPPVNNLPGAMGEIIGRDAVIAAVKRPRAAFTCDMAKAISAPVLLSNGERSQHFFFRIIDQLAACLPNSERIVVAQSSHTVPGENPDAYDQAVLTFLAKH
jgi:pimeloyl-ACP methyl ester carboxylesterase